MIGRDMINRRMRNHMHTSTNSKERIGFNASYGIVLYPEDILMSHRLFTADPMSNLVKVCAAPLTSFSFLTKYKCY